MWYRSRSGLQIKDLYFNFLPSWWARNYGISFGMPFVADHHFRNEVLNQCSELMYSRFGHCGMGEEEPRTDWSMPEYHNSITPLVAGCDVVFPDSGHPWSTHLAYEKLRDLSLPRCLSTTYPYSEIIRQAEAQNTGRSVAIAPSFGIRGILNDALLLRGTELFTDQYDDPCLFTKILDYCYGLILMVIDLNCGVYKNPNRLFLTNCTESLVSPSYYGEHLLAYDRGVAEAVAHYGAPFGIHHCGIFDPYVPLYRQVSDDISFLEIGWGSDIALAMRAFPESEIQYIIAAGYVLAATPDDVRSMIRKTLAQAEGNEHRFSISVPDMDFGTPDVNLLALFDELAMRREK